MSQISRLRDAEISNGNLINADDIDAELNQLVSESNSQDTRLTSLESSAMTIAGVKTFSAAPKTDQIDERTADTGVTIDSVLHKDGYIKVSPTAGYAPSASGELGYDSTSNTYKVMENGVAKTLNTAVFSMLSKSSAYTAVATDKGALFLCTSTFTLSLTTAATLGSGWFCEVRNDGSGIITIDPNSTETIDGALTITVYPGEAFKVVCDGSNFKTVGRPKGWIPLASATASSATSVDFTSFINSDFDEYVLLGEYVLPTTDAVDAYFRVSTNGGSSYLAGTEYTYTAVGVDTVGTSGSAGAQIKMNRVSIGNASGEGMDFEIRLTRPWGGQSVKGIRWFDNYRNTATGTEGHMGSGLISTSSAINAVRFLFSSGNISQGSFKLFGVRT